MNNMDELIVEYLKSNTFLLSLENLAFEKNDLLLKPMGTKSPNYIAIYTVTNV